MTSYLIQILVGMIALTGLSAKNIDDPSTIDGSAIKTVSIKLEGTIKIDVSPDDSVRMYTKSKTYGKIWGISNKDEVPEYQVETVKNESSLDIRPSKRAKKWSIGIDTQREEKTHYIQIPKDKIVIVTSNAAKIISESNFNMLKIKNAKGNTTVNAITDQIRYVTCKTAENEIIVNNVRNGFNYENVFSGQSVIDLTSKSGNIELSIK